jgi:N-acetylneuraminate lyase
VTGAFINGTTGEGLSLSENERILFTEAWLSAAASAKDFSIIVNVGASSLVESKQLAVHAQETGADAIAMLIPGFFKPKNVNDLINVCSRVAAQAKELDFYYYHIPGLTGVNLSMYDFVKQASKDIPNFKGLKYSTPNFFELHQISQDFGKRFDLFFGSDELLVHGLLAGANGAVGSTYNYMCPLYQKIVSAYEKQDLLQARKLQNQSIRFVDSLIQKGGGVVAGKAIMSHVSGLDFGPCRLPLRGLSKREISKWLMELEEMGFFKF